MSSGRLYQATVSNFNRSANESAFGHYLAALSSRAPSRQDQLAGESTLRFHFSTNPMTDGDSTTQSPRPRLVTPSHSGSNVSAAKAEMAIAAPLSQAFHVAAPPNPNVHGATMSRVAQTSPAMVTRTSAPGSIMRPRKPAVETPRGTSADLAGATRIPAPEHLFSSACCLRLAGQLLRS